MSLLEKLRKKMKTATASRDEEIGEDSRPVKKAAYNKKASKHSRKVKLGWLHEGKQVRKRNGGGTRIIEISKNATKEDLLFHSKELFFPHGESKKGKWEEFTHSIYDFKESELGETVTVGELYTISKFGILRFYLHTQWNKEKSVTEEDNETDRDNIFLRKQQKVAQPNNNTIAMHLAEKQPQSKSTCTISEDEAASTQNSVIDLMSCDSEVIIGGVEGVASAEQLDDTLPVFPSSEEVFSVARYTSTPVMLDLAAGHSSGNAHHELFLETHVVEPFQVVSSTEEVFSFVPSITDANYELLTVAIKLHRVHILEEMIGQFKDELILDYPLKFIFINEKGHDVDGVSRDVYAAFWTEFLDCAAEGADMRVPSLSPKWQEDEWKAVGRILAKGFLDQGYFPLRIAPAFIIALIFGEHSVSADVLYESLLLYLSQCERDLLTTALQQDLDSDGQDELLDLLDRLGVKTVPSQEKLKAVLIQVAHKQIVQQPKYALDNMSAVASQLLKTSLSTTANIQTMYDAKKPTARKVLKLIEASPVTPAENQAFRFLQQYIRGLDQVGLGRMLRFVTGSDVICITKIEVVFTTLDGLARRPVAHTCGSVLELPSTYNSYPELRAEMENILTSNYYTMDIV